MRIVMLQAFFDDSFDSEVLIYAGFIGSVDAWLNFSADWDALLQEDPVLPEFKMQKMAKHAKSMRRSSRFFDIIKKHNLIGVGVCVPKGPLNKVIGDLNLDPMHRNPYFLAWRMAVSLCIHTTESASSSLLPIDFVFDDQTEKAKVMEGWEYYENTIPDRYKGVIMSAPSFRKSHDVLPLQAADMIAFWARKQYRENKDRMLDLFPVDWVPDPTQFPMIFAEGTEDLIRAQFVADIVRGAGIPDAG